MSRRTDPAFRDWAAATEACLALMRANERARMPRGSRRRIAEAVERRLRRYRAASLRAYRANA